MRKDLITIGFLISLAVNLFSQSVDFRIDVSTHMNSANYLVANDDTLFAATSTELIVYDIARQQPERYTVVNGIYDHHLTAMTRHRSGLLILGSLSGKLSFLDLAESAASNDVNLEGDPIVDVLAVEDTLWVLSRNFVSVYLYNNELARFQFRESYQEFGQSLGEFTALAYAGRRIWLGNAEGLVSAPANFLAVNLYAEDNWDIQTTADGLPSNRINDILADPAGGQLYIATDQGLSIYDFNGFSTVTAGLLPIVSCVRSPSATARFTRPIRRLFFNWMAALSANMGEFFIPRFWIWRWMLRTGSGSLSTNEVCRT